MYRWLRPTFKVDRFQGRGWKSVSTMAASRRASIMRLGMSPTPSVMNKPLFDSVITWVLHPTFTSPLLKVAVFK